eukprot:TRINITY_DN10098_c0_g1_i2.p1 TRINITY_DN10098_c0_g1~~TRINITY_DN10098_c0_g1_i2.p1  ORF type:complete len:188 (-),score=43.04 TRINITY_DN10098_c0_g1_i2:5-568(-)
MIEEIGESRVCPLCPTDKCFLRESHNYSTVTERFKFYDSISIGDYTLQVWRTYPVTTPKESKIQIAYEESPPDPRHSSPLHSPPHHSLPPPSPSHSPLSPLSSPGASPPYLWQFNIYKDGELVNPLEEAALAGMKALMDTFAQVEGNQGADWMERRWPEEQFCLMMRWVLENFGYEHLCPLYKHLFM